MRKIVLCGLLALTGLLTGCGNGPFFVLPGGALEGAVATEPVSDWSFLDSRFVHLETNADAPYSVELNYIVRDGALYLDPSEGKRWLEDLRRNPNARVRFGETIYPVTAVLVGEPGELPGFDSDRFIYRLDYAAP
ncbi:MAG: hypothetical protein AAF515_03035 [Pseudomonadota bacterium]